MTRCVLLLGFGILLFVNFSRLQGTIDGSDDDDYFDDYDEIGSGLVLNLSTINGNNWRRSGTGNGTKFGPQGKPRKQRIWKEIRREVIDMKNILPNLASNLSYMELDVREMNRNFFSIAGDVRFIKHEVMYIKRQAHVIWENVTATRKDHKAMNLSLWWILGNVSRIVDHVDKTSKEVTDIAVNYGSIANDLNEAVHNVVDIASITTNLRDMSSEFSQIRTSLDYGSSKMTNELNVVRDIMSHLSQNIVDIKDNVMEGFEQVDYYINGAQSRILANVSEVGTKINQHDGRLLEITSNVANIGHSLTGFSSRVNEVWDMVRHMGGHMDQVGMNILKVSNQVNEFHGNVGQVNEKISNVGFSVGHVGRQIDEMGHHLGAFGNQFVTFLGTVDDNFNKVHIRIADVHDTLLVNMSSVREDIRNLKGQLIDIRQVIGGLLPDLSYPPSPHPMDDHIHNTTEHAIPWPSTTASNGVSPSTERPSHPPIGVDVDYPPILPHEPTLPSTVHPSNGYPSAETSTAHTYPYPPNTTSSNGYPITYPPPIYPQPPISPTQTPAYPPPPTPPETYPTGTPHPSVPPGYPQPPMPPAYPPHPTPPETGPPEYSHPSVPPGYPQPPRPPAYPPYPTTPQTWPAEYPYPPFPPGYPQPPMPPGYPQPPMPPGYPPYPSTTPQTWPGEYPYPPLPPGYPQPPLPPGYPPYPSPTSQTWPAQYPYPPIYPQPPRPPAYPPYPTTPQTWPAEYPYPPLPPGYPQPPIPPGYPLYPSTTPQTWPAEYPYPPVYPQPPIPPAYPPYPTTPQTYPAEYPHPPVSPEYPQPPIPPAHPPRPTTPETYPAEYPRPPVPPEYPQPSIPPVFPGEFDDPTPGRPGIPLAPGVQIQLPQGPHGPGLPIGCGDEFTGYCACVCSCDCTCPVFDPVQSGIQQSRYERFPYIRKTCQCLCSCPCRTSTFIDGTPSNPHIPIFEPPPGPSTPYIPVFDRPIHPTLPSTTQSSNPGQFEVSPECCEELREHITHEISLAVARLESKVDMFKHELLKNFYEFFDGIMRIHVDVSQFTERLKKQIAISATTVIATLNRINAMLEQLYFPWLDSMNIHDRSPGLRPPARPPLFRPGIQPPEFTPPGEYPSYVPNKPLVKPLGRPQLAPSLFIRPTSRPQSSHRPLGNPNDHFPAISPTAFYPRPPRVERISTSRPTDGQFSRPQDRPTRKVRKSSNRPLESLRQLAPINPQLPSSQMNSSFVTPIILANETMSTTTETSELTVVAQRSFPIGNNTEQSTKHSKTSHGKKKNKKKNKGCKKKRKTMAVKSHSLKSLQTGEQNISSADAKHIIAYEDNDDPSHGNDSYDVQVRPEGVIKAPGTDLVIPNENIGITDTQMDPFVFNNMLQEHINNQLAKTVQPGSADRIKRRRRLSRSRHGRGRNRYRLRPKPLFSMMPKFPFIQPPMGLRPPIPPIPIPIPPIPIPNPLAIRPPPLPNRYGSLPPGMMVAGINGSPYSLSYNDGKGNTWNVNVNRRNYDGDSDMKPEEWTDLDDELEEQDEDTREDTEEEVEEDEEDKGQEQRNDNDADESPETTEN